MYLLKVVDQDLIDATIQDIDTFAPPLPMAGNFFTESPKPWNSNGLQGGSVQIYFSKVQKYTPNVVQPQVKTVEHLRAAPVRLGHMTDG
jgi:hypothetical protein